MTLPKGGRHVTEEDTAATSPCSLWVKAMVHCHPGGTQDGTKGPLTPLFRNMNAL